MMGNNELRLNEATMIEAVQLWLNDQFKIPPTVTSVEQNKTGTYSKEFSVQVQGPNSTSMGEVGK